MQTWGVNTEEQQSLVILEELKRGKPCDAVKLIYPACYACFCIGFHQYSLNPFIIRRFRLNTCLHQNERICSGCLLGSPSISSSFHSLPKGLSFWHALCFQIMLLLSYFFNQKRMLINILCKTRIVGFLPLNSLHRLMFYTLQWKEHFYLLIHDILWSKR